MAVFSWLFKIIRLIIYYENEISWNNDSVEYTTHQLYTVAYVL